MLNRCLTLLLCVVLNTGCGTDFKKPTVDIPAAWPHQAELKKNDSVNLATMQWWQQFKSPELTLLIQKARQQNGEAQIAIANIEYSRNQLKQVQLNWLPNITALAGYSQFPMLGNPGSIAMAYPAYITNIVQLIKQQKSAKALYQASIDEKNAIQVAVIAQTAASFFTLIAQKEELHLYRKLLADYQSYAKIVNRQYQSGLITQDDWDQANSTIKQIESQTLIAQHNITVSQNALHFLLNENPGPLPVNSAFNSLNTNAVIPGNIPASVLNNRPDVQRQENILRAAHADVGAVTANLLPTVNLGAYLGTANADRNLHLGQAYITTPIVDLPIFAQIGASKSRYKQLYIQYIVTIKKALRDVANDLSAFATIKSRLEHLELALHDEKNHCHLDQVRYQNGLEDGLAPVKCAIQINQLAIQINQNKLEKMIALVRLYQDMAGGYNES